MSKIRNTGYNLTFVDCQSLGRICFDVFLECANKTKMAHIWAKCKKESSLYFSPKVAYPERLYGEKKTQESKRSNSHTWTPLISCHKPRTSANDVDVYHRRWFLLRSADSRLNNITMEIAANSFWHFFSRHEDDLCFDNEINGGFIKEEYCSWVQYKSGPGGRPSM